jgi:hypothetical protein
VADVDEFSQKLFEEAKRFLEKARAEEEPEGRTAYLHAALNIGFCALEAHINAIADDFLVRSDLSVLDRSILAEREIILKNGQYELTERLKIHRLEDRLQFIYRRYSGKALDKSLPWWTDLKIGLKLRNELTHPKEQPSVSEASVERSLLAIIEVLDAMYKAVYHTAYPVAGRRLDSTLAF